MPSAYGAPPAMPPAHGSSSGMPSAYGASPAMPSAPGTSPGTAARPGLPPWAGAAPPQPAPPLSAPRAPAPPAAPPEDSALDGRLGDRAPWGDGFLRRAARFAVHLVATTRATRELAELATAAQAPVTTGRRIAVVSVAGGAGRSTVTALLGSVFAARRADHVLVADADPDHGSLAWRLGLAEREGLGALGPRLLNARGVADLDTLLPRTPAGLRLLPGPAGAPPGATREVTRAMSRFFAVCVTDCGRGLQTPSTAEVLQDAHGAVVVVPATPDGVRSSLAGLAHLPPALLQRSVVALNTTIPGGRAALHVDAAREVLARTGAALVVLPHDRHLAAATPVLPGRLAEATAIEATRLAGLALARAGQAGWAPPGGPR
jgi:MinD-like ATPase involved in chromosome partitioning or flagellar assembly